MDRPEELMTQAQRGRHDEAAHRARRALAEPDVSSLQRIGLLYALACAEYFAGRLPEAEDAAASCEREAVRLDDNGWRANALAMRAMVRESNGAPEAALDDAIEAEVLLSVCDVPGLRNWAFSGLGTLYTAMRLYELALPHFVAASQTPEQALPYADGEVVDHYNLADLHLRWSRDLERVGLELPERQTEHAAHLAEAQRWIDSGTALVTERERSSWRTGFDRMRAQAASTTDPSAALDELERLRRLDREASRHDDALQSTASLARAFRLLGRVSEAQALAVEAVGMLAQRPENDPTTAMDAYFQLHQAQLAAGVEGSASVSGYVTLATQLLWEQRTRSVEGVRARREYALLQREHAESRRLAREDPLTRLGNRRAIDEWLHEHSTGPAALVLIDLDGFKQINDTFGHESGDVVLMRVAGAVRSMARDIDLVARFGGDEFVVLVSDSELDVPGLAKRVAEAVAAVDLDDVSPGLRASASIGTASVQEQAPTHVLLHDADRLLMRDKRRASRLRWTEP